MKNIFFAILTILMASGIATAQNVETASDTSLLYLYQREAVKQGNYQQLYYGARIGIALSNLGGDADSTSRRTGLVVGAFAGMDINSQISWQVGLSYIKQGARIESDSLMIGIDGINGPPLNANYNYLSLPINIRYFPSEAHGLFLAGGIAPSLLLKAEVTGLGGDFSSNENNGRIAVKDRLNSIDFGLQAGIGYEWIEHLEFSMIYQYGFGNTLANSSFNVNNRGWQITIGYKL